MIMNEERDRAILQVAKDNFLVYRLLINPKMKIGWWVEEVAKELQQFYKDFIDKKKPKLVIEAPAQHGKSSVVVDFISWLAGKNRDVKTIYASYSERLGVRANLRLQRTFDSITYKVLFGDVLNQKNTVTISSQYLRNREILEYVNGEGYFRNTTVRGAITGESLDLGVIDDPIKNREEANSLNIRDKTWEWYTDDFSTRFSENGALLVILTRWHIDDPIGRLINKDKTVKVLKYKAIATEEEKYRKKGDSLFPEHKSLEFLLERKKIMDTANFEALYQQSPILQGGDIIKGSWFKRYDVAPQIKDIDIFLDTAMKTGERNDYSVIMVTSKINNVLYILEIVRGKWLSYELKQKIIDVFNKYALKVRNVYIEDKASGTGLIQDLQRDARMPIKAVQVTKDKFTRLQDVLGYIESGYIHIPLNILWANDFIQECESFRADMGHAHDDQVDALTMAINNTLIPKPSFWDVPL